MSESPSTSSAATHAAPLAAVSTTCFWNDRLPSFWYQFTALSSCAAASRSTAPSPSTSAAPTESVYAEASSTRRSVNDAAPSFSNTYTLFSSRLPATTSTSPSPLTCDDSRSPRRRAPRAPRGRATSIGNTTRARSPVSMACLWNVNEEQ